jgi:hypothetical protein
MAQLRVRTILVTILLAGCEDPCPGGSNTSEEKRLEGWSEAQCASSLLKKARTLD